MTADNRRKEGAKNITEAKMEDSGRNLVQPLNSAMADKAEKEQSILPNSQHNPYIPKIERVVGDYNIQEADRIRIEREDSKISCEQWEGTMENGQNLRHAQSLIEQLY